MLHVLAETLRLETGALVSIISAAVGAGAFKGMDLMRSRQRRLTGPDEAELCSDHEKRLVKIETALEIEVPALKHAVAELGLTFERGLTGVHKRLDHWKDAQ